MSYASASYQCTYIADDATYTIALLGGTGDIFQMYKGSALNPDSVIPQWNGLSVADRPVIKVVLMTSDSAKTQQALADMVNNAATEWYVNDELLQFTNAGLSTGGSWNGLFSKIGAGDEASYPFGGLRINGNLVTAAGGLPIVIKCVLGIEVGGAIVGVHAPYPIRILQVSGESAMADIYCGASQSFALDEDNTSVTAQVRCWKDGVLLATTDYTVIWYLLENGTWVEKSRDTTFTVTRDDIATFGEIKAECYTKGTTGSPATLIASDRQTVSDSSDPFIIYPNPSPADGKIRQTGGPDKVTFTPKLKRVSGEEVSAGIGFLFAVLSPAGVLLNTDSTTTFSTYDVPKSTFDNLGAGPVVNITAVQTS